MSSKRKWFAIRTKSRREELARLNYIKQGFIVYLPLVRVTIRHARKTEQAHRPFFPGYLFLYLAPEERQWHSISSTYGAIGPVRFGDRYPEVPDWIINDLKESENGRGAISLHSVAKKIFQQGSPVSVNFANQDLEGIFINFSGKERSIILLDLLSRQIKVTVPLDRVEIV